MAQENKCAFGISAEARRSLNCDDQYLGNIRGMEGQTVVVVGNVLKVL